MVVSDTAPLGILHATLAEVATRTPEVSTDEMRRIVEDKSDLVIDSRPRPQFDAGHIPGAVCLDTPPPEQVEAVRRVVAGNTSTPLIVYCNGPHCLQSRRLGEELAEAGFSAGRRYQLGISVWRALGGPTVVGKAWIEHVLDHDETVVMLDARSAQEFSAGTLPRGRSCPVDAIDPSSRAAIPGLPHDDFNRRIILFGNDAAQARRLALILRDRPWANVSYVESTFAELAAELRSAS